MKISKYTFFFNEECNYYAYNTLSNALLNIDEASYKFLMQLHNNEIPEHNNIDHDLWHALEENNIITENDVDDFLKYKSYIMRLRNQKSNMHLTIAPTMDCCFHCHYCFEKFKDKQYMTEDTMEAIVKYVKSFPELKNIKITWFGGEPLMAVHQIEQFYNKISTAWPTQIKSNIITTGYHIDKDAISVIQKVGITSVQITLDGLKETHNKVKYLAGEPDVFERVIRNIELLNTLAPEINIVIRVNLTQDNAHEYTELCQFCFQRFRDRKNISIAPAFVLDRGVSNCNSCNINNTLFKHKDRSQFILDLAHKGYDSPFIRYPEPFFYECAIRNDMAIAFDPEGYAYKCWEIIGDKEYAIGKLNQNGKLTNINYKNLNRQLFGADPLDDPICAQCTYLPLCNGGCPIQRIQNKFENGNNNTCTFYKGFIADFLKIHVIRKRIEMSNTEI